MDGAEVVGGAVDNGATERLVDWSAFLCEYAACLAPPAGPVESVPGNNVTYRRALLERFAACVAEDRWEDHLHRALAAGRRGAPEPAGYRSCCTASGPRCGGYAGAALLVLALVRGATGGRGEARSGASLLGLGAAALPPLLFARVVRSVWRTGRYRRQLLASLPLLVPYVIVWAAGEVAGAWLGPGDAMARVA